MRRRSLLVIPIIGAAAALVLPPLSSARSGGGCPQGGGWEQVSVADLGISPDVASGIPSLDGNADGETCIKPLPNFPLAPDTFIFRDNTVGA